MMRESNDPEFDIKVDLLFSRLDEAIKPIGLYMERGFCFQDGDPEFGNVTTFLPTDFMIGKLAFSKRVQDPLQSQVDDQFNEIRSIEIANKADEIRKKYNKEQDDGSEGTA